MRARTRSALCRWLHFSQHLQLREAFCDVAFAGVLNSVSSSCCAALASREVVIVAEKDKEEMDAEVRQLDTCWWRLVTTPPATYVMRPTAPLRPQLCR